PLMNGYSGYTPATYQHYADAFWYFPEDWAIKAMKDAGVTHVVVHPKLFARDHQDPLPAIARRADFELLAIGDDGIRLYRLRREGGPVLSARASPLRRTARRRSGPSSP